MRRFLFAGLLVCTAWLQGAQLEGDFGYKLGEKLATDKIVQTKVSVDGSKQYQVKTMAVDAEVWVRSNKQQLIYRITSFSEPLSPSVCAERLNSLRKDVEAKKPGLGIYALDDAEMFYDDQRTLLLLCEAAGKSERLRIEYTDDRLAEE